MIPADELCTASICGSLVCLKLVLCQCLRGIVHTFAFGCQCTCCAQSCAAECLCNAGMPWFVSVCAHAMSMHGAFWTSESVELLCVCVLQTVWAYTVDTDRAREVGVAYDHESYSSSRSEQNSSVQNQQSSHDQSYAVGILPQWRSLIQHQDRTGP